MKFNDLAGRRFERIQVLAFSGRASGTVLWQCRCDCGTEFIARAGNLLTGHTRSCGCLHREMLSPDIAGQRFGRVVAVERSGSADRNSLWICRCDCGNEFVTKGVSLRNGGTQSCGCARAESSAESNRKRLTTHGMSYTRTFKTWSMMLNRCLNPRAENFRYYDGRGIAVCERWRSSFENFLADMGERPPDLTIDRYPDKDGNYEPGNCRWATWSEQNSNKRSRADLEQEAFEQLERSA